MTQNLTRTLIAGVALATAVFACPATFAQAPDAGVRPHRHHHHRTAHHHHRHHRPHHHG